MDGSQGVQVEQDEIVPDDELPVELISHPLERGWTLWFDKPVKVRPGDDWFKNVKSIWTFESVEDFWGVYNNIMRPSQLEAGNYHLFKQGVEPRWEDHANQKGGKWTLDFPQSSKQRKEAIDEAWLYSILACIGEQLCDDPNEICGIVVQIKPKSPDRLALWTRSCDGIHFESIGDKFKRIVAGCFANENVRIEFKRHEEPPRRK